MEELAVVPVVFERRYGYPVGELRPEGVNGVVDNDHILELPVFEYSEVLYINVVGRFNAIIAVHAVLYQSPIRVNVVQDNIRVPLMARCENNDLKVFVDELEALASEGPDIEADLDLLA